MNRIFLQLAMIALIIGACNNNTQFRIDGKLPNNSYDGEWIYLVPMVNAPVERVDSTIIENARFCFESKVEAPEIYIIRGRPKLRLTLQELLVVKEPGEIQVSLGKDSFAEGTALNDSLQHWKEQKHFFDNSLVSLRKNLKNADESEKEQLKNRINRLTAKKNECNYGFALNNRDNVVGQMVIRLMKGGFSSEQRKELGVD